MTIHRLLQRRSPNAYEHYLTTVCLVRAELARHCPGKALSASASQTGEEAERTESFYTGFVDVQAELTHRGQCLGQNSVEINTPPSGIHQQPDVVSQALTLGHLTRVPVASNIPVALG